MKEEITNDILIADALLKIKTLERLLIAKGIFTEEELLSKLKEITEIITAEILKKSTLK